MLKLHRCIIEDDDVSRQFADLLLQKQAEGIEVDLLYASLGSMKNPSAFFQCLRDGGMVSRSSSS